LAIQPRRIQSRGRRNTSAASKPRHSETRCQMPHRWWPGQRTGALRLCWGSAEDGITRQRRRRKAKASARAVARKASIKSGCRQCATASSSMMGVPAPVRFRNTALRRPAIDSDLGTGATPTLPATRPTIVSMCSGLLNNLVGLFLIARFVECVSQDVNSSIQAATRDRRRVVESAVWIDENAYAAISLEGMAQRIGLSGFRFLRMFQSVIGITPHQYLVR
jgi:hypothetical protein